eukprot:2745204-Rhodomonas_salina.2
MEGTAEEAKKDDGKEDAPQKQFVPGLSACGSSCCVSALSQALTRCVVDLGDNMCEWALETGKKVSQPLPPLDPPCMLCILCGGVQR